MTREEILRRLAAVRSGILHLAGLTDENYTDEHQRSWDWLNAEHDWLDGELQATPEPVAAGDRATRAAAIREAAADPARVIPGDGTRSTDVDADIIGDPAGIRPAQNRRFQNPWDLTATRSLPPERRATDLRSRAEDAVERMSGMSDRRRETAQRMLEMFDNDEFEGAVQARSQVAEHILIGSDPAYLRAFSKLARGREFMLTGDEREAVQRAMSLTNGEGGFMVPFQLDPVLILTSDGSVNPFRAISRVVMATGDVWNGVSAGNTSWSWDAEAAEASDDASTFAQPTITIHKGVGFVPISFEALGDIPNAAEQVAILLAEGKDDLEATAFATGSGTGQPFGIVTALTGTASEVAAATADTFAVADVYNLDDPLPAKWRQRASWVANHRIYNDIRQFGTADSHALFTRLQDGMPERLLGHPRYESSAMDGVINAAATNFILVLGDFRNYVIADRLGTTVEFVPHLVGTNHRPTGQRGWYAWFRAGADSVNDAAFRMLNA